MFGSKAQNIITVKIKAQLECWDLSYDVWPSIWQRAIAKLGSIFLSQAALTPVLEYF